MKKSKIPTIIGIFFLVIGLAAGVFLVQNQQIFRLGASADAAPKDVRITNITDTSFSVSWTTGKETTGFLKWGESQGSLDKVKDDEISTKSITHHLTVTGLAAQKDYYFKINSDGDDFDNSGNPWQITTGVAISKNPKSISISGSVVSSTGEAQNNVLVYVVVAGSSPLSTTTSKTGAWVINISSARTLTLNSYISINEDMSLLEIAANAGPLGYSTAQIYPKSAKPVPPIILGQTMDFKNNPASDTSEIPNASVGLPDSKQEATSKFNADKSTSSAEVKTVTLESIDNNETVATTKPEFFGEGPTGTTISITVESEVQTGTVKVPTNGDWKWTPPADLEPGVHKVKITWRDAAGILRTLERNFIVSAAEGPAFTSTPSGSISPTANPTTTPTISTTPTTSVTPTATRSATPTTTITTTLTATPTVEVPVTGSLTPTLLLTIMGIAVVAFATMLWRFSEK